MDDLARPMPPEPWRGLSHRPARRLTGFSSNPMGWSGPRCRWFRQRERSACSCCLSFRSRSTCVAAWKICTQTRLGPFCSSSRTAPSPSDSRSSSNDASGHFGRLLWGLRYPEDVPETQDPMSAWFDRDCANDGWAWWRDASSAGADLPLGADREVTAWLPLPLGLRSPLVRWRRWSPLLYARWTRTQPHAAS